jgi:hypothetical protein
VPSACTPLRRQVLPACRDRLGLVVRVGFISACMTLAFMNAAARWAPPPARRETVLERIHEVPVPSLCESRHGVWQQCYRYPTTNAEP